MLAIGIAFLCFPELHSPTSLLRLKDFMKKETYEECRIYRKYRFVLDIFVLTFIYDGFTAHTVNFIQLYVQNSSGCLMGLYGHSNTRIFLLQFTLMVQRNDTHLLNFAEKWKY